jgi:hypothetical protein
MKKTLSTFFLLLVFLSLSHLTFGSEVPADSNSALQLRDEFDRFLDRLGEPVALGPDFKLGFDGQFRHRLELRDDFNFNRRSYEDDAINLLRSRLGAEVSYKDYIRVYAQGQDAESFSDSELNKSAAFINTLDLYQLYGEIKKIHDEIPVGFKVGRQELSYGDQRFVGAFGWSNVARVFDAAKVMMAPTSWFKADAWFSQVVLVNRGQADSADHSDNFYGIYTTAGPYKKQLLDTFMFIRHNLNNEIVGEKPGERGQLKEYTLGNRFKGNWEDFDYGIEWAVQFGSRAHDDIRAWAWHNETGYTIPEVPWSPRIYFEYNRGSGDNDPRDGDYGTFDNLYPTNHIHYGYIDFASLKNMNHWGLGAQLKPHKRFELTWAHHWFRLATNRSPWFNAGQAILRPATSGASETVGNETDLTAKWKATNHLGLLIGYSHFHAGPFVRDTGAANNANFFYVQTTLDL